MSRIPLVLVTLILVASATHGQRVEYPSDYPRYFSHSYRYNLDSDDATVGRWRYYNRASARRRRGPLLSRKEESIAGIKLGPIGANQSLPAIVEDTRITTYAPDAEAQAFARVDFGARSGSHGVRGWASIEDEGRYARAYSRSKLSSKTGTRTGRGSVKWNPRWRFSSVRGSRKVGRAWVGRDPVDVTLYDNVTGQSITERLFDLQVQMGEGSSGSWEDGRLQIDGIDGAFYVAITGDHLTSSKGSMLLEFGPQGLVTQSVATGVFSGALPAVGAPARLDLNIADYLGGSDGYLDLDFDFDRQGDFEIDIETGGDGLSQIMANDPLTTTNDFTYFQTQSVNKLLLGTPFHSAQSASIGLVRPASDEDLYDGYLELSSANNNLVAGAFDRTSFQPERSIVADFALRMQTDPSEHTDGLSFLLVPSWMHNATGPVEETLGDGFVGSEAPGSPEALSFGFDDLGEGGIVSMTWDGRRIATAELFDPETAGLLTSGDWTQVSVAVRAVPNGTAVDLSLSPSEEADAVSIFSNVLVDGMDLHQSFRPVFASRADERWASRGIDNVAITFDLSGDADGNGSLDVADIDRLTSLISRKEYSLEIDVNLDGRIDKSDLEWWLTELNPTWIGDANLDGAFDSSDLVQVFVQAKYETDDAAVWSEGDWNADGRFDSSDLAEAFANGGYNAGTVLATAAVPEPSAIMLVALGLAGLATRRR